MSASLEGFGECDARSKVKQTDNQKHLYCPRETEDAWFWAPAMVIAFWKSHSCFEKARLVGMCHVGGEGRLGG